MTVPPFPPAFITPFDLRGYRAGSRGFSRLSRQLSEPTAPADLPPEPEPPPLRASSVCLIHRPQSSRERAPPRPKTHPDRYRSSKKRFLVDPERASSSAVPKTRRVTVDPVPKQRKKPPPPPRVPCAISVKNLSLPMTYLGEHTTAAPSAGKRRDSRGLTRPHPTLPSHASHPDLGRLECARSNQTENRLLIQIGEAEQVSDFERILGSNAILRGEGRARGGETEEGRAPPRPRSHYSVSHASDTYHYLFQRHVDSVQGLIREYRDSCGPAAAPAEYSILGRRRDEPLDLSEFYDDDSSLCEELRAVADFAIDDRVRDLEVRDPEPVVPTPTVAAATRNFRVNLSGLIVARGARDSLTPEPGERRASSHEDSDDDREWEGRIMSACSEETRRECDNAVATLARQLSGVELEGSVPIITLSDCCEQDVRRTPPAHSHAHFQLHLTVPAVESGVEARPPPPL